MSSNMLVGEKRWVSSRRTGMTLLGKVVVPKPINLPSQRLENHGLDPNAEIVPKGTINWGNRSSLSTVNAWNSLASSPKSDAGSGFSSDVSARPSSGGSGTRPSTAASDRAHEPVPSAWGPNSRPSSASGPLSSNQSSLTSLRPRSAETRPGSSQLSRFAEPLTDNSVTLIPSEKSGGLSSTSDGFNLSCGDFPTLGSQKENSGKNTDFRDNGSNSRPRSSSSLAASVKEKKEDASIGDASINSNVKTENVDTWRRDGSEHFEGGGAKHNVEKWQGGDTYAYSNPNMPPQLVDAWHGHPGVWYRGPPLGPGGFPLDPFPYYGPQIQTAGLANSQPMVPPNNRPRGHHPGNPDHWPHIPDAYMHPSMPIRPGFYSSPMPYEGYYRPPMVFSSSKEHDIPFNGTPPGHNRYSVENSSNPGKEHARDGCARKSFSTEHVESGYQNNSQGQCRVLLKQHHEMARKEDSSDWKQTVPTMSTSKVDIRGLEQTIFKDERGNVKTNESGRHHKLDTRSWSVGNQKHDSNTSNSNVYFNSSNVKAVDFDLATNSHNSASSVSSNQKPILIEKIEGLNAKARVSEGLLNFGVNARGNTYHANDKKREGRNHHSIHSEETDAPMQRMNPNPTAFNNGGADLPRVLGHGMQGKHDDHHHGKRFNAQGGDGWQKKPHTVEVATVISGGNLHLQTPEDAVQSRTNYKGSKVEEHSFSEFDISNDDVQRAKLRETAKERAKQLQREEEERTKDLKAKALAKLEQLNKRAQPSFGLVQKVETPGSASVVEQERTKEELKAKALEKKLEDVNKRVQPAYGLVQKVKTPGSASVVEQEKRESNFSTTSTLDSSNAKVVVVAEGNSKNEPCHTDSMECKAVPQPIEGNIISSRHKAVGHNYKQKENGGTRGKMMILTEKSSVATTVPGNQNEGRGVVDEETTLSLKNVADSLAAADNNRKKNNRSNKMKPKLDDAITVNNSAQQASAEFPETVSKEEHSVRSDPVQKDTVTTIEEEEANSRIINHNMKTGQARPFPKNQQINRKFEKFRGCSDCVIWAPVRAQNNTEANGKKTCDEIPTVGKGETEEEEEEEEKNNEQKKNKKRAEMKRYVPKPVVVAMGGSTQLTPPDEVVVAVEEKEEVDSQKMACPDHQHPQYKQKKTHGWRQRESSTNGQSSKGVETKSCDVGNAGVDYSGSFPDEESKGFHVDERGMRRYTKEKSHMHFNNGGNNPDKKTTTTSQKEKGGNNALKENRGAGDRNAASSSHWQPKSQQSNSSSSSSKVEQEVVVVVKKESKITLAPAPVPAVVESSSSSSHDNNNVEEDTRLLSKNGNQNSRYGKGSSYQYHNNNNNRERQRQKDNYNNYSRMEYKPVGGQKHNNKNEETGESSNSSNTTTRYYREKNQSHSAVHY